MRAIRPSLNGWFEVGNQCLTVGAKAAPNPAFSFGFLLESGTGIL